MSKKLRDLYIIWETAWKDFVGKADALLEWTAYKQAKKTLEEARRDYAASKKAYDKARHALPERLIAEKLEREYEKILKSEDRKQQKNK